MQLTARTIKIDVARSLTMGAVETGVGGAKALLLNDPVVAALLAIILLVLLGGLAGYIWNRQRSPAVKFRKYLAAKDAIAVLMHSNPDPDAMACALGVKYIAEQVGTEVTLHYPGEIRHQENRAFRTVLDLDLDRIEKADDLAADEVVLVDHNEPRGFDRASNVNPFAVIDHHPGNGTGKDFTDVRPDYGACASIIAEYFDALDADPYGPEDWDPQESDCLPLPSKLATGLLYGIQSDTKRLSKGCSSVDFEAYTYLYPWIDEDLLDRIANPLVDTEVIEVKRKAIKERDCRPPYAISDVGSVSNLDAIPQAADELICVEDSTAVVVLGVKDNTLHLSGRSRDDRVHMGRALSAAVEDIPMADAGGHARMGGGQVSIPYLNGIGPSEGFSREEFHERLFEVLDGEG